MKLKTLTLAAALLALTACDNKVQTSVPADSAPAASAASAAPVALVEGLNYTTLSTPIPQQQAGKVEVLEFFGYFCPHCAHLEPVLSKHVKTFKDDTYLRTEHVVWGDEMKPLARLAAAVDIAVADTKDIANSHIFDAMVNQKVKLQDPETLKNGWPSKPLLTAKKSSPPTNPPKAKPAQTKWQS